MTKSKRLPRKVRTEVKPAASVPSIQPGTRPRRKNGKTEFQLNQKAAAVETQLARRENFIDQAGEVIRDRAACKRRLAARRRVLTAQNAAIDADDLKIRFLLERLGPWLAEATGFGGGTPQAPALVEAWRLDPEGLLLFLELCIANATDPSKVRTLRQDQAMVEVHGAVNREGLKAKKELKGQRAGKIAADARGQLYKDVIEINDPRAAPLFKKLSASAIQKRANQLGLESRIQLDDDAD